jgi:hypothetical protein
MTLGWFSTRCWLWYEVVRCRGLRKGWLAWYPVYRLGLWIVWKGTSCTDWDGGWIGKVHGVRIRFVESLAQIS